MYIAIDITKNTENRLILLKLEADIFSEFILSLQSNVYS